MAMGLPFSPQDMLTVLFAFVMLLFGLVSLVFAIISCKINGKNKDVNPDGVEMQLGKDDMHDGEGRDIYYPVGKPLLRSRLDVIIKVTALMCFMCMLLVILFCVTFDHLHVSAGVIFMLIISYTVFLYCLPYRREKVLSVWWKDIVQTLKHKAQFSPKLTFFGLIAILLSVLALNIGLEGACLDNLDIMSTRLSRSYQQPTCVSGRPCYVYLTLSRNISSTIIVNHHTTSPDVGPKKGQIPPSRVLYDTVSHAQDGGVYQFTAFGRVHTMSELEVERDVHWTHLTNLDPNTTYYFVAGPGYDDSGNELWSEEFKFRTGPADDTPVTFMVGGDMGNMTAVGELTSVAADQEPLFAVVGGDIAYEYAQFTCYRRVDTWLGNWMATMRTQDGYYIPLLTAIGNHEVYGDFGAKPSQVPFYTRYFPHMAEDVDPGTDGVITRATYHEHYIGNNTLFLVLDSGHVAEPTGTQAAWLTNQLESTQMPYKFVTYHVPMYPTIRTYENKNSMAVRDAWLPIFDQYGVDVAFENHDHAYKRTSKLYNGAKSTSDDVGTLYVGDGCWGIKPRALPEDSPRWYHEKASSTQYVLRVNVSNSNVVFSALEKTGGTFDDFRLTN